MCCCFCFVVIVVVFVFVDDDDDVGRLVFKLILELIGVDFVSVLVFPS